MLFNSAAYGAFLLGTLAVFWLLGKHRLPRALFLVLASYGFYFYGTWDAALEEPVPLGPWGWSILCLGVIFVGSTLDYWVGRALARVESPAARRGLLLCSIVYYLGVLSAFKYWNFAADSFAQLATFAGLPWSPTHLRLVLPFGISFFTFETMSYTIDVYRRELPPAKRYLDYLLFVAFFPHLVAGPIVRPRQMLPQFAVEPAADEGEQARALWLIATGLGKKMILGDTLSVNLVGRAFGNPERFSSIELLVAVYGYAIQIYCDFSGYTDVAIGSALLFGYKLPPNFDAPYTARNLQEFWHRWHISLSTWLRDYLYIPLGGSRRGSVRTYVNLMITMVLGGLWHGASWNFVIWGALHGGGLAVTRMWQRWRPRPLSRALVPVAIFFTFQFVCFAWVFFRAPTFAHATLVLSRIARGTGGTENLSVPVMAALGAGLLLHFMPNGWVTSLREALVRRPAAVQGVCYALAAYALRFAATAKPQPFVYGQF